MALDIRTFWLFIAVSGTGVGILVLLVRNAFPPRFGRLLTCYSLAHLSLGAAFFFLAKRDWTGEFFFDVVSWVLILLSLSLEYLAFCLLKQQVVRRTLVYGPAALAAAICIPCTLVHGGTAVKMLLVNIVAAITMFVVAWTLVQPEEGHRPLPDLLSAASYAFLALVTLAVIADALRAGAFPTEFNYNETRAIYHGVAVTCIETIVFPLFLLMVSERINRTLTVQAMRDPLTGLYNRRAFEEIAYREIAGAVRTKAPFSILLCDLDHLKAINDRHGHAAGDALLSAAAANLRESVRNEDFVCRWGGDEFCALLPRAHCEEALLVAENVRQIFETARGPVQADGLHTTISIGIVTSEASDADLEALVQLADGALYRAKKNGRNRVAVAGNSASEESGWLDG